MLKILLCFLLLLSNPALASDFEDDLAATSQSEHLPVLRKLHAQAMAGDAEAQLNLGGVFFKGQEIERDYAEAAKWFHKAAAQGLAQAQFNLGMLYATGRGVAQDAIESARWYRRAAEQGLALAQLNLGVAYATGEGVTQNEAEAVKWFRLAANQKEAQAQFNLGVMYANGQGVKQDLVEACRLARLAAAQGHEVAPSLLADLEKKMTAEQRLLANKSATREMPLAARASPPAEPVQPEKTVVKTPEKTAEKSAEKPAEKSAEKPSEKMAEAMTVLPETGNNYVQLSAFKHPEQAERVMAQLQARLGNLGKPYGIYHYDGWVRIHVGPYATLDEARSVALGLRGKLGFDPMLKQH